MFYILVSGHGAIVSGSRLSFCHDVPIMTSGRPLCLPVNFELV